MKKPSIADSVFCAPGAQIVGDVTIGERSSVWYNAVLRGDCAPIVVGQDTNIQDAAVLHCSQKAPTIVGNGVTVGHSAILHSCTVGDHSLIGMGTIVLDQAIIGKECLIGAGSVVLEDMVIPDGSLAAGNPAKIKRLLTEEERAKLYDTSLSYMVTGRKLKKDGYCI